MQFFIAVGLLLVSCLCFISADDITENVSKESLKQEEIYIKLLKRQRAEQLKAIKNFQKIKSYEKKHEMVHLMSQKIFAVIQDSRAIMEGSAYIPGVSDFPTNEKTRNALSNIIENTALISEVILRFPDIAVPQINSNNNWNILLQWSIAYCHQVKYLLDKSTIQVLHLVSQELNHIPREENYVNPYQLVTEKSKVRQNELKRELKKKNKKIKKGPRLSMHDEF